MPRNFWPRMDIVFIVVIVVFACIAAYLSIRLTRPKPFANAGLSVEWQCRTSLGILTVCSRNALFEQRLFGSAERLGVLKKEGETRPSAQAIYQL
jgi:hypothetical protein